MSRSWHCDQYFSNTGRSDVAVRGGGGTSAPEFACHSGNQLDDGRIAVGLDYSFHPCGWLDYSGDGICSISGRDAGAYAAGFFRLHDGGGRVGDSGDNRLAGGSGSGIGSCVFYTDGDVAFCGGKAQRRRQNVSHGLVSSNQFRAGQSERIIRGAGVSGSRSFTEHRARKGHCRLLFPDSIRKNPVHSSVV